VRLTVEVVPKSSRNAVVGWIGEALKVRVTAPPDRGRANEAVRRLMADTLELRPSRIRIATGPKSRRKVVEIEGLDEAEIRRRIDAGIANATER
jgi:uncharacterized protein (TIGR00251 family)